MPSDRLKPTGHLAQHWATPQGYLDIPRVKAHYEKDANPGILTGYMDPRDMYDFLPSESAQLFHKIAKEQHAKDPQGSVHGSYLDAEGRVNTSAAMNYAYHNNLVAQGGGVSKDGTLYPTFTPISGLNEAGLKAVGRDEAGQRLSERRRSEQASTALQSVSTVGSRQSNGSAVSRKGLTDDMSLGIRRETQLGLGGSGRGKLILG
jgi:hypothetical protein